MLLHRTKHRLPCLLQGSDSFDGNMCLRTPAWRGTMPEVLRVLRSLWLDDHGCSLWDLSVAPRNDDLVRDIAP